MPPKPNLTFESTTPPFLLRLRGQHSSQSSDPDRHTTPQLRARKRPRTAREDDDDGDGPVYVDSATGGTLSGFDLRVMRGDLQGERLGGDGSGDDAATATSIGVDGSNEEQVHSDVSNGKRRGSIVDVGMVGRKKKQGVGPKVVAAVKGDDEAEVDGDVEDDGEGISAGNVKGKRKVMTLGVDGDGVAGKKEEIKIKVKKKGKKIKLSFDEDGVE